jgi:CheY-like chemotaxis protein
MSSLSYDDTVEICQALQKSLEEPYCDPSHIVLVDNFAVVRNSVKLQLEQAGYQVTPLASGEELIQHYQKLVRSGQRALPAILTEYRMKGIDGATTAQIIKDMAPAVKIILFTADVNLSPRAKEKVDSVLIKPVTFDEIEETLFSVIDVIA